MQTLKPPKQINWVDFGSFKVSDTLASKIEPLLKQAESNGCKFVQKQVLKAPVEKSTPKRQEVSIISAEIADHAGEVVLLDGLATWAFEENNKPVLMGHDYNRLCGNCVWLKHLSSEGTLRAKTHYKPRPEWYEGEWLPDLAFALIETDMIRGKSIGYLELEKEHISQKHIDERPDWDGAHLVCTRSVLLEYSVVVNPCNPAALVETIEKGTLNLPEWYYKQFEIKRGRDWGEVFTKHNCWRTRLPAPKPLG